MSKITLNAVGSLIDTTTAANTINANSVTVQTAFDNTLSRDGTSPNTMGAILDMNSNQIINLPAPISGSSPARLQDIAAGNTVIVNPLPTGGTTGQILTKNSSTNYDAIWSTANTLTVTPEQFGAIGNGVANDTAALQQAVALGAAASSVSVFLKGVYAIVGNITGLHSCKFFGSGVITRSGNSFTPDLNYGGTNNLYVSTTGSDTNDGLDAGFPILTPQVAVNALTNYGSVLKGRWNINLAAGTYYNGITFPEDLTSGPDSFNFPNNRISLIGPAVGGSPNNPTAIINGSVSPTTNYGLLLNGGSKIYVQDISFNSWNANSTTYGIDVADISAIYLNNVHCTGCYYGVITRQSRIYIQGGVYTNCSIGLTFLNHTLLSVGNAQPVTVSNCSIYGVNVGETSSGHFDGGSITACPIGIYIVEQSHVQMSAAITNCTTTGIQVAVSSSYLDAGNTYSGNTVNILKFSNSVEVNSLFNSPSLVRIGSSPSQATTVAGATTPKVLYSNLGIIPQYTFQTSNNTIYVKLQGTFGGNNGTRTLTVALNGVTAASVAFPGNGTTNSGGFMAEFVIDASNISAQVANSYVTSALTPFFVNNQQQAGVLDMSAAAYTISLVGQCANTLDQIVVNRAEVFLS